MYRTEIILPPRNIINRCFNSFHWPFLYLSQPLFSHYNFTFIHAYFMLLFNVKYTVLNLSFYSLFRANTFFLPYVPVRSKLASLCPPFSSLAYVIPCNSVHTPHIPFSSVIHLFQNLPHKYVHLPNRHWTSLRNCNIIPLIWMIYHFFKHSFCIFLN